MRGWGYVSVMKHVCKALGLIPNTTKANKNPHLSYFVNLPINAIFF